MNVSVTPEYFAAAGVALVSGRAVRRPRYRRRDRRSPIVNETLARQLWPDESRLERRDARSIPRARWSRSIGVVKDGKYILLWEAPRAMLFRPLAQATPASATLEVVTAGAPDRPRERGARRRCTRSTRTCPRYRFQSMADYLEYGQAFLIFRIGALFAGIFGVLGLILASIGLYGVVAYDITQRTHEIGVRMALGALRADILREVLARGARLAVRARCSAWRSPPAWHRLLRTLLLGVSPFDPLTYGGTAVLLIGGLPARLVRAGASSGDREPARRTSRRLRAEPRPPANWAGQPRPRAYARGRGTNDAASPASGGAASALCASASLAVALTTSAERRPGPREHKGSMLELMRRSVVALVLAFPSAYCLSCTTCADRSARWARRRSSWRLTPQRRASRPRNTSAECPLHPAEEQAPAPESEGCTHDHGSVREAPESVGRRAVRARRP